MNPDIHTMGTYEIYAAEAPRWAGVSFVSPANADSDTPDENFLAAAINAHGALLSADERANPLTWALIIYYLFPRQPRGCSLALWRERLTSHSQKISNTVRDHAIAAHSSSLALLKQHRDDILHALDTLGSTLSVAANMPFFASTRLTWVNVRNALEDL